MMDLFQRFVVYADYCMAHPMGYSGCNELWGGVFLIALCAIGILVLNHIYGSYRGQRAEQRAIQEIIEGKRVASPEVMEQLKWKADQAPEARLSYDETIAKGKKETPKRKDAYQ
jgi:hypothetical protein